MAKQKIFKLCEVCKGTGTINESGAGGSNEQICPLCNGAKKIEWGYLKVEPEE